MDDEVDAEQLSHLIHVSKDESWCGIRFDTYEYRFHLWKFKYEAKHVTCQECLDEFHLWYLGQL